jgi:hypothetical protein
MLLKTAANFSGCGSKYQKSLWYLEAFWGVPVASREGIRFYTSQMADARFFFSRYQAAPVRLSRSIAGFTEATAISCWMFNRNFP